MNQQTALEKARSAYQPKLPDSLRATSLAENTPMPTSSDTEIRALFPHTFDLPEVIFTKGTAPIETKPIRAGVILSGGPAPGGHNVIAGLDLTQPVCSWTDWRARV
jgi:pyrophosphate--fructose-6-phosphate 1-phosphotransferase